MATFPAKTNYAAGNVLTAAQMVDIGEQINALNGNAGKNKIINGDFGIWQRGTSITASGTGYFYHADRFQSYSQSGTSSTASRQTFTAGTAPVAGYEGQYFARIVDTANSATMSQRIEDVRTFAGQTVTFSFWAKSASNVTGYVSVIQQFGSGGSSQVYATINSGGSPAFTTSWQRFTVNISIPSVSGKTIGTGSLLFVEIGGGTNNALDTWGWQLEAGSVATAFQTATGTLAGEYAAAQRYFQRFTGNQSLAIGEIRSSTQGYAIFKLPVTMRSTPVATYGAAANFNVNAAAKIGTAATIATDIAGTDFLGIGFTLTGYTAGQACYVQMGNTSATIDVSAEL